MTPEDDRFHPARLDDELDALAQTTGQPATSPSQQAYRSLRLFFAGHAEQEAHTLEHVRQQLLGRSASAPTPAPLAPLPAAAAAAPEPQPPTPASRTWAIMRGIAAVLAVAVLLGSMGALLHARLAAVPLTSYHFRVIPSPNTSLAVNTLTGLTVRTSTDAWAWGAANEAPTGSNSNPIVMPLVEHWDGHQWRIVATPQPPEGGQITDIVALAPDDAWAVGGQLTGGAENTSGAPLVEHWDGHQWKLVQDNVSNWPNASGLTKLAALSADDIWAVGQGGGNTATGLIQHWNGRTWQTVANPSPEGSQFSGITALAPNDIWVVGMGSGNGGIFEHWDGHTWSVVSSPDPSVSATFTAISAVSADDIWAAGTVNHKLPLPNWSDPVFEHWDGHTWSVVSGPSLNGTVSDIVALGPNDVWAVGTSARVFPVYLDVAQQGQGLVEHWNGQSWSLVANPTPHPFTTLSGVARDPSVPGKIWIAGMTGPAFTEHDQLTDTQTLIETTQ